MKIFILLAITLATPVVFAADYTTRLVEIYQSRMAVLDRDLVTFHYERQPKPNMNSLEDLAKTQKNWAERFYKKYIKTGDMAGPGLYVAIDPYGSRSFGGEDPQLYVIHLKKGARLLNTEGMYNGEDLKVIKEATKEFQCMRDEGNNKTVLIPEDQATLFSLRQSTTPKCRELIIRVMSELKVQGILYDYSAANSLENCRTRGAAINIISGTAVDFSKMNYYSNARSLEGTGNGGLIKKLYEESMTDFILSLNSQEGPQSDMPKTLASRNSAPGNEYASWKANSVYNCGPKWSSEKDASSLDAIIRRNTRLNFVDKEIQSLLLDFKRAFVSKSQGKGYFQITNIVKFNKLSFQASGLPQDEATYKRWRELRYSYYSNPEARAELKKMFNTPVLMDEVVSRLSDIENFVKTLSPQELNNPDLQYRLMLYVGMSPSYALVQINEMNMYEGKILISQINPAKSFAENLAASKETYKAAIKECIERYSSSTLTYEEIQKTDCGPQ